MEMVSVVVSLLLGVLLLLPLLMRNEVDDVFNEKGEIGSMMEEEEVEVEVEVDLPVGAVKAITVVVDHCAKVAMRETHGILMMIEV